jgi:lipopolysaccharide transport system permease protein
MTSIIPDKYHWLIMLNPMTGVVMAYHKVLLYNSSPELKLLIYPFTIACISLILALIIFKKANEEMADLL